jgi:hypothetical protein
MTRLHCGLVIDPEPYSGEHRAMLLHSHYLANPPPGCMFAIAARPESPGIGGPVGAGPLLGVCLVGRPVARMLPQDGSVGEVTRLVLSPGLPYATASAVLRRAAEVGTARGMSALISYHDRTRHTGCIYRKAGFKKDGVTKPSGKGWASRNRASGRAGVGATSKRRWRLTLDGSNHG